MQAPIQRVISLSPVTLAVLLFSASAWGQQPILGGTLQMKTRGVPNTTKLKITAKEVASPSTLAGDPQSNGATLVIIANGVTSEMQTFSLPAGERWRRSPRDPMEPASKWSFKGSHDSPSPVKLTIEAKEGQFKIKISMSDRGTSPITVVPPNPATYIGALVTISGPGGDTYCINFGGAAGGTFSINTATAVKIAKPTSEATCPTMAPACGDGVIQSPAETCDGGNDAACPGRCGANGLPCSCPYCGDAVVDSGESCDGAALGSCADGCTYSCTCTTCGNGVQESPKEDCDGADDDLCPGQCLPPPGPNRCLCRICGDDEVNQASEQCDGTADTACPGGCTDECTCAVCGDGIVEASEQCDPGGPGGTPAPDLGVCPEDCLPTCACP